MLGYLPKVIFVRFDGATWQLPGLPVGVYPILPVERTWTLNKDTGAKVTRKGFTLVPDFASTAFMIQGTTLEAMIADCGDLWSDCRLSDMNNAYVILSRVKRAIGLLLMRAFSAKLFQQGEPPGPKCLLKLLLSRFNIDTGTLMEEPRANYSPADAEKEYFDLEEQWSNSKRRSKAEGSSWPCGLCGLNFPAEGFGADSTDTTSMYNNCIAPGSWRMCLACKPSSSSSGESASEQRLCTVCNILRFNDHFESESTVCASCTLQDKFKLLQCSVCDKTCRSTDCYQDENNNTVTFCLQCAPRHAPLLCTVCKESKHPGAFSALHRQGKADNLKVRRCKSCSERCSECQKYMADARGFATGSSLCWQCDLDKQMLPCARCGVVKRRNCYDPDVMHNHTSHRRLLVCLECYKLGYSCDKRHGTEAFRCAAGHDCGHLAFETQLLKNVLRPNRSVQRLICKECQKKPKYKCSIKRFNHDQPECYEWKFSSQMLKNWKSKKSACRLVCHDCCQLGFTTRSGGDIVRRCEGICRRQLGPQSFASTKSSKRICNDCKKAPYRGET